MFRFPGSNIKAPGFSYLVLIGFFLFGCTTGSEDSAPEENNTPVEDVSSSEDIDSTKADSASENADTESQNPEEESDTVQNPEESPDAGSTPDPEGSTDAGSNPDTIDPEEEVAEPIGNPVEELVSIDHESAYKAVEKNITDHLNDLESALSFLNNSHSIQNMIDMLSDDEDEEGEDGEEGEESQSSEDDDDFEIDLSDVRDGLIEFLAENIMVESTSKVSDDGLSITYAMEAAFFCDQEPDDDPESEEQKAERMEEEEACAERLSKNPTQLVVTSDGKDRMNLSIQAGKDSIEALSLQIHDDLISIASDISKLNHFFMVLVDPEDFALPATMEGSFGCEIRENSELNYSIRCSVPEAINAVPSADQDPYGLKIDEGNDALTATIDGSAETIEGMAIAKNIQLSVPWQMMVDLFYDDEGEMESVCEPNDEGGMECSDQWVEPTPAPDVEETLTASLPHVQGTLNYASSDDTFRITEVAMNGEQVTLNVDEHTIVAFNLNPKAEYVMGMNMRGDPNEDMRFQMEEEIDLSVKLHWEPVSSAFEDPPSFLMDETISVRFEGSDTPTIDIERGEDTQVKVSSGTLTLSSTAMEKDVVIAEGQCFGGIDTDEMSEEEQDALHDLFGELVAETCEE